MSVIDVVDGGTLPQMPTARGNSEKLMLFGIRTDTGETVLYHLSTLIKALHDGEYIPALAEDLNINTDAGVSYNQRVFIETTGGDADINSEKMAFVRSVRGTDNGIPASGAVIRSTGLNQIKPSGINGQSASFLAVASAWGEYGKSTENNGYLFTDPEGNIITPATVKQNNVAVPTHTENGVVYYLPSLYGEVVATFNSGVDVSEVCAHICWSNYRDHEYAEYVADEIPLSGVISAVGGALRRATNSLGQSVFDEIVMSKNSDDRLWWRRVGSSVAKNLNWSMDTITSVTENGTNTSYRFSATVDGMKSNGVFCLPGSPVTGFYVVGNVLMVESSSLISVNELKSALGGTELKYELSSPVTGTHNLTGELRVDDFGTIMLVAGSETSVDMDIEFASYWRDVLKNIMPNLESDGLVTALSLVSLEERISRIERGLSTGISRLAVDELVVKRKMSAHLVDDGSNDSAVVLYRSGAPAIIPSFVGQRYINSSTGEKYTAKNVNATTDWVLD